MADRQVQLAVVLSVAVVLLGHVRASALMVVWLVYALRTTLTTAFTVATTPAGPPGEPGAVHVMGPLGAPTHRVVAENAGCLPPGQAIPAPPGCWAPLAETATLAGMATVPPATGALLQAISYHSQLARARRESAAELLLVDRGLLSVSVVAHFVGSEPLMDLLAELIDAGRFVLPAAVVYVDTPLEACRAAVAADPRLATQYGIADYTPAVAQVLHTAMAGLADFLATRGVPVIRCTDYPTTAAAVEAAVAAATVPVPLCSGHMWAALAAPATPPATPPLRQRRGATALEEVGGYEID